MCIECEKCPECGSDKIDAIDRVWNEETQRYEDRYTCWSCDHDWHDPIEQ